MDKVTWSVRLLYPSVLIMNEDDKYKTTHLLRYLDHLKAVRSTEERSQLQKMLMRFDEAQSMQLVRNQVVYVASTSLVRS